MDMNIDKTGYRVVNTKKIYTSQDSLHRTDYVNIKLQKYATDLNKKKSTNPPIFKLKLVVTKKIG